MKTQKWHAQLVTLSSLFCKNTHFFLQEGYKQNTWREHLENDFVGYH